MSEITQHDAQPKTAEASSVPLALNKDTIQDLDAAAEDVKAGATATTRTITTVTTFSYLSDCCKTG